MPSNVEMTTASRTSTASRRNGTITSAKPNPVNPCAALASSATATTTSAVVGSKTQRVRGGPAGCCAARWSNSHLNSGVALLYDVLHPSSHPFFPLGMRKDIELLVSDG